MREKCLVNYEREMRVSPLPVFFLSPLGASACRGFTDVLMLTKKIHIFQSKKDICRRKMILQLLSCYDSNELNSNQPFEN